MSAHTSVKKGKRVMVMLKDGTHIVDRFEERTSKGIILVRNGLIPKKRLRAMSIYREGDHAQ